MRPEVLRLSAFCAYAGEQVVDFRRLGEHRLFLIHGPTGSGKTSVLDGLCYALFGESSGKRDREPVHLRSLHADDRTPTFAELDFALGPTRWRVRRSPAQRRPHGRRKGEFVEARAEAALWRLVDGATELIADKEREVAAHIEDLLGCSSDEFRQVVLLPQGRFRELLTAAPGDRQRILATLFGTDLYRRIKERLATAAKEAERRCVALAERRRALLDQAQAEDEAAAEAGRAALAQRVQDAEARRAAAEIAAQQARAAAEAGRRAADALARASAAMQRLDALRAETPAMEARRARLEAARRAERLSGEAAAWDAARKAASAAATEHRTATEAAAQARLALDRATAALADAPDREQQRDAASQEAARLRHLLRQAEEAAQAAGAAASAAAEAEQAEAARAEAAREAGRLAEALRATQAEHAAQEAVAAQQERHRLARDESERRARDAAALTQAAAKLERLQRTLAEAEAQGIAAATRHRAIEAARLEAARALAANQAAHLAAVLVPGTPCPVCGATDHPRPAVPAEDSSAQDLDRLQAEEAAAARDLAQARERFAELRAELRAAEAERTRLLETLNDAADAAPEALAATLAAAREALSAAEAAARALPTLERRAAEAEALAKRAADALAEAEARARAAATRRAAAEAARDALLAALPDGAAAPASLRAAATAAEARAQELTQGLARDREAQAAASSSLAARSDAEARAASAAEFAAHALAAQEQAFARACAAAGFADAGTFTAARLPEAEMAALADSVAAHERALADAEGEAERARQAASDVAAPDLPALETAAAVADAAMVQAAAEAGAALSELSARDRLLEDLRTAAAEFAAADEAFRFAQDLAETTSGRNPQRLDLEGWVLRSLLDEALSHANHRLRAMLGGRYTLRRREEPARANAAIGLDIEVLDEWSGAARPAGTLSGGEGFCTALALALGLSDTVLAHAGARRMDALFVDEGFGTLDEEALDTAMEVLAGLQGADRLVGIISHVPELRGRIAARLEVTPGRRGSTAAFRFG